MAQRMPAAVDLFSGLGGLTAGLKDAGVRVVVASEIEEDARLTYGANHPEVKLLGNICDLDAELILKKARRKKIDIVVGCPPCQGFSRLTEKHRRRDPRNALVLQFLRLVTELQPTICMMENVPGLLTRGKSLFKKLHDGLEAAGYNVTYDVLELADFGVPQLRKRLVLMAGLGFEIPLPKKTHPGPDKWVPIGDAIGELPEPVNRSELPKPRTVPTSWHVARDIAADVRKRLAHAAKHGGSRNALPDDLVLDCHRKAKKRNIGFSDVYGVFDLDRPSPTITSGCTNVSKGRFGHPIALRPLTPREAAMVQTLGREYKLRGSGAESIAAQIGNALPRRFAEVAGRHLLRELKKRRGSPRASRRT